jgi:hypothetical protein
MQEIRENGHDIGDKKSRGLRRSDVRGLKQRRGRGYGYRRTRTKPPRKPRDDQDT